ncbi:pentapeptide repeat-containing protein [Glaciibacter flavus]|nr:pentapeptide repeat-containing protein [Glaciibacter flavus]
MTRLSTRSRRGSSARRRTPSAAFLTLGGITTALLLGVTGCTATAHPVQTNIPGDTLSPAPTPSPTGNSADTATVSVPPDNPYYELLIQGTQPPVGYGTTVNGCVVAPRASCPSADLSKSMLRGALFEYADLTGARLDGATIALANFSYASLAGADLSDTTLTGVSLNEAYAPKLSLAGSVLRLGSIANSDLTGANLQRLNANFGAIIGSDLSGADLANANLSDSDINGVNLTGANLSNVNLANADLTGSTLTGANLHGAVYCNTLMPNGHVKNPKKGLCPGQATSPSDPSAKPIPLPASNVFYPAINALINGKQLVSGSKIGGCAIQAYTQCRAAKLAQEDLQGAFLAYSSLQNADLSGAKFFVGSMAFARAEGVDMSGIQLGGTAAVNANMAGAKLDDSKLSLAVFTGADLRNSTFTHADARIGSFAGADARGAKFTGADLSEARGGRSGVLQRDRFRLACGSASGRLLMRG